ncbi:MAG: hypothetical protein H6817_08270 [Phycisphaerales bacterium]|nr:hypothetical protein [Phycisphaerales bacterium]
MNAVADIMDERPTSAVAHFRVHAEGYHVRCSRCGAMSIADTARDRMRICCPGCDRRLTLPANLQVTCPSCATENTFAHHLAGHSASCASCGRIITLGPLIGEAKSRHRMPVQHVHRPRGQRTPAFADGAERSLFILAAAIGTLIFLVATSLY